METGAALTKTCDAALMLSHGHVRGERASIPYAYVYGEGEFTGLLMIASSTHGMCKLLAEGSICKQRVRHDIRVETRVETAFQRAE